MQDQPALTLDGVYRTGTLAVALGLVEVVKKLISKNDTAKRAPASAQSEEDLKLCLKMEQMIWCQGYDFCKPNDTKRLGYLYFQ